MLLDANVPLVGPGGTAQRASATRHPLPNDAADALITDPPYYDAVPYADLSDYFYVWLRRCLQGLHGSMLSDDVTPKSEELIMSPTADGPDGTPKDEKYFENGMREAMDNGRRVLAPNGIAVVVFAHKTTVWESPARHMRILSNVILDEHNPNEAASRRCAENRL